MCGIAGFFGDFESQLLSRMGEAIAHRGPDGHGELLLRSNAGNVGLAHRRLSIIDLSPAGTQPMTLRCPCCGVTSETAEKESVWLSYNGELYNFPELKKNLEQQGHQFHSKTDTEVILHLYVTEGVAAFKRLNGIFAFALYDGRSRGQRNGILKNDLILVRDGLGVKPLYYAETNAGFLFGSEMKALLEAPELDREMDPVAIRMYLSYLYAPVPYTAFKAVSKLDPGSFAIIRQKKIIRSEKFYQVPYEGRPFAGSEKELTRRLEVELKAAVKRQLISDVPVGAFLSGGMDSSSVVALMSLATPGTSFRCFTIGDGEEQKNKNLLNDLHYAKLVAKELSLDLSIVDVRPANFDLLEKVIFHLDEPQADPAAINAHLICEHARREGIKVLMSGAGGDDIFSGYPRHSAVQTERLFKLVPDLMRGSIAEIARKFILRVGGASSIENDRMRRAAKVLSTLDYSQDERLASFFLNSDASSILPLLGERFTEADRAFEILNPLLDSLSAIPNEKDVLNRMLYLESKHFLGDHNLNYVDKMSMANGVEVRVPLLDLEVVNLAAQIPSHLKRHYFENKYIFKRAVKGLLPPSVYTRKKQGFGLPIRKWLSQELAPVVDDALSPKSIKERGLFNSNAVAKLIQRDRAREIDATFPIYSMMCIELWCRRFLDTQSASATPLSKRSAR